MPYPVESDLVGNRPALWQPVPAGQSLTTVLRAESPACASPGSVLRLDRLWRGTFRPMPAGHSVTSVVRSEGAALI